MRVHVCRAVQRQQFDIALLLLEGGADPMFTCTMADGEQSLPPLTALIHSVPTGQRPLPMQLLS